MEYENHRVLPKQPFFVLATKKYYKSVLMDYGISHFYQFTAEPGVGQEAVAIPDGTVDILFCCNADHPFANICGTVMHPQAVIHRVSLYFGVRFLPGIVPANFNVSQADLVEHEIPVQEVVKDKELFARIMEADNFEKKQNVFMDSYLRYYYAEEHKDSNMELYLCMLKEIIGTAGEISVADMAEKLVYSERYVNKIFKGFAGLAPKKYCKLMKFQYLLDHLDISGEEQNLALLAYDMGFYDQSHMIKIFKDYTMYTPQKYLEFMQKEQFSTRLIVLENN